MGRRVKINYVSTLKKLKLLVPLSIINFEPVHEDVSTYLIVKQRGLRRVCTNAQTHQNI